MLCFCVSPHVRLMLRVLDLCSCYGHVEAEVGDACYARRDGQRQECRNVVACVQDCSFLIPGEGHVV